MRAARGTPSRRNRLITDINITPLVDILLVLLVVLMVVSTYIVSQAMNVELPRTAAPDIANADPLTLTLFRDGEVRIDGRAIPEITVPDELANAFRSRPDVALVISAEVDVPHGRVLQFVDLARRSGGTRFAIKAESGMRTP
jgi:biopolymer transport protein ExbD